MQQFRIANLATTFLLAATLPSSASFHLMQIEQITGDVFGASPFARVDLEIARSRASGEFRWPELPSDVSPYLTARLHVAQGRHQQALLDLEAAAERRCGWLADIGVDPELDALRGEPRFRRIRRALGV